VLGVNLEDRADINLDAVVATALLGVDESWWVLLLTATTVGVLRSRVGVVSGVMSREEASFAVILAGLLSFDMPKALAAAAVLLNQPAKPPLELSDLPLLLPSPVRGICCS